jgi:hypothetical protein
MDFTFLYVKNTMYIPTVKDYINSFSKYSVNKINYVDFTNFDELYSCRCDGVIIHYTVMHYLAVQLNEFNNLYKTVDINSISPKTIVNDLKNSCFFHYMNFFKTFNGIKVCIIQDEYYETDDMRKFCEMANIDLLFTCVPTEHIYKIYNNLSNTNIYNVLTGYIPENNFERIPIKDRNTHIFYRGRELHYFYGDLGQDKYNIGIYMKNYGDKYNLITNIDCDGNNSIYGDEWFKTLGSSKTTLATDSGCNIFDIYGILRRKINIYLGIEEYTHYIPKGSKYSYTEVYEKFKDDFKQLEISQGQVSPKMFEAIMLGTVLVMYEGNYSGILLPDVHYIPLKKDYSNIEDVINKINNDNYLQEMADRAYNDIVISEKYSYKSFIRFFDSKIEEIKNKK